VLSLHITSKLYDWLSIALLQQQNECLKTTQNAVVNSQKILELIWRYFWTTTQCPKPDIEQHFTINL